MTSNIIAQGAEAIIYKINNKIVKDRIPKKYRISVLDNKIRKSRTKSEAKIINKLQNIIPVPKIIKTDEKQTIEMQFIQGKRLSDNLESLDYKKICRLIAKNTALMHNQNIIHGDLTTSNMIYIENDDNLPNLISTLPNPHPADNNNIIIINKISAKQASERSLCSSEIKSASEASTIHSPKVYFIDFGLAFHSSRIEDKAVDLHLLQQALEAKHFTIWKECWKIILEEYEKNASQSKDILQRIKIIESRGRYKDKY